MSTALASARPPRASERIVWLIAACIVAAAVFGLDLLDLFYGAVAVLYIVVVLLVAQRESKGTVLLTGLACIALASLSFVIQHQNEPMGSAHVRFAVAVVAIGFTTFLSMRDRDARFTLAEQGRILELTHGTVVINDTEDTIQYWNDGAEQLYGWTREEAFGVPCARLLKTEVDMDRVKAALDRDGQWSGELIRTRRDGTRLVLASRWLARLDPEGRRIGVIETSQDLTEQRHAEAKIRRLVDADILGICIWTLEGAIVEANDAFLRLLQYSREDLISARLRWTDLTPAEWRERDERAVADLRSTGHFQPYEKEYIRKDGRPVPVLIGGALIEEGNDEGVAFVLDLTERKRADAAVRESEGRFRDYAETASDWFWEIGPDYKFTLLTENAFGLDTTERIGTASWDHALDLETEPDKWQLAREMLDARKPFRDFVYLAARRNGAPIYVKTSGKPVFESNGQFRGYRGTGTDVTDIIRAQEALRESEQNLRSAIDGIPGLVGILAPDGAVEAVNRQILEYCGQSLEDLKNWGMNGTVHPEDLARVAEIFGGAIASGVPYQIEQRMRRFDGVYRWFDNRGVPAFDAAGQVKCWYVLLTDIDDRQRAEEAREISENRYRSIFHAAGFAAWETDWSEVYRQLQPVLSTEENVESFIAGHPELIRRAFETAVVRDCNQAMLTAFDATCREDIVGRNITALYTDETIAALGQALAAFMAGRTEIEAETQCKSFTGRIVDALVRFSVVPGGEPWSRVIVVAVDFTERNEIRERVELSERRYRSIFHSAGFAAWESDCSDVYRRLRTGLPETADIGSYLADHPELVRHAMQGSVVRDCNQASLTLFNATCREDLVGHEMTPLYTDKTIASLSRALAAFMAGETEIEGESQFVTFSGDVIDVVVRISLVPAANAPWSRVIILGLDVTERNEIRARLVQLSAELAHAARVAALGQLSASIAHEVNQPLTAILSYGKSGQRWLSHEPPEIGEALSCFERIVVNGTRAADIISGVRSLARKSLPKIESLNLVETIREALALVEAEARDARSTVTFRPAESVPLVCADRVQIQQVVINLLMNGLQAMAQVEDRPRRLTVVIGAEHDGFATVCVRDSGSGIALDDPNRIFEPFFTTKAEGMGMGLSICRSIIEAQGGRISASNNDDAGATVAFSLPIAVPNVALLGAGQSGV